MDRLFRDLLKPDLGSPGKEQARAKVALAATLAASNLKPWRQTPIGDDRRWMLLGVVTYSVFCLSLLDALNELLGKRSGALANSLSPELHVFDITSEPLPTGAAEYLAERPSAHSLLLRVGEKTSAPEEPLRSVPHVTPARWIHGSHAVDHLNWVFSTPDTSLTALLSEAVPRAVGLTG